MISITLLHALKQIATDLEIDAQHGAGISRLVQMIADGELEVVRKKAQRV